MYNMNVPSGHDAKVHTLNPTDNWICQAKLTEVYPSNISWQPLLVEILNSSISAGTYHGQCVAISLFCGANQFEPQIGLWGHYATLYKTVYLAPLQVSFFKTNNQSRRDTICKVVQHLTFWFVVCLYTIPLRTPMHPFLSNQPHTFLLEITAGLSVS